MKPRIFYAIVLSLVTFAGATASADWGGDDYDEYIDVSEVIFEEEFEGDFPPEGWEIVSTAAESWMKYESPDWLANSDSGAGTGVPWSESGSSDERLLSPVLDVYVESKCFQIDMSFIYWLEEKDQNETVLDFELETCSQFYNECTWETIDPIAPGYAVDHYRTHSVQHSLTSYSDSIGWVRLGFRFKTTGAGEETKLDAPAVAIDRVKVVCWREERESGSSSNNNRGDDEDEDESFGPSGNGDSATCGCMTSRAEPAPYLFAVMLLVGFLAMGLSLRRRGGAV
jgi:hypothetical protein